MVVVLPPYHVYLALVVVLGCWQHMARGVIASGAYGVHVSQPRAAMYINAAELQHMCSTH
jgi:hypothetical protein